MNESERPSKVRLLLSVLGVLSIAMLIVWWPGCRSYPRASTPESQEFIKQLYTACNTKDAARLGAAETKLAALVQQNKVVKEEKEAFQAILATAKAGNWDTAMKASLQFAQDQVR